MSNIIVRIPVNINFEKKLKQRNTQLKEQISQQPVHCDKNSEEVSA